MVAPASKLSIAWKPLFQTGDLVCSYVPLCNDKRLLTALAKHSQNISECTSFTAANQVAIFMKRGIVVTRHTIDGHALLFKTVLHHLTTYVTSL